LWLGARKLVATVIVCHDESPVHGVTLNLSAVVDKVTITVAIDRTVNESDDVPRSHHGRASVPVVTKVLLAHRSVPIRDVSTFDEHFLADFNGVVSVRALWFGLPVGETQTTSTVTVIIDYEVITVEIADVAVVGPTSRSSLMSNLNGC